MPEESTTPDLAQIWSRAFEAINGGDVDAAMSMWGPDPVWDLSPMGLGVYEGLAAIRGFWEEWTGAYEEFEASPENILHLDNGVTFAAVIQKGRPAGSTGDVHLCYGAVAIWLGGEIMRVTNYGDINEARAAAERLAEERG